MSLFRITLPLMLIFASTAARAQRILPNPVLTPGVALSVTAKDVCVPGYSKKIRNVPDSVKRQAYALYGIKSHKAGEYEVDHLISLELGGSNSINNLWPELMHLNVGGFDEGAKTKDALENRLHAEVCSGRLSLSDAQQMISSDWTKAYLRYFGHFPKFSVKARSIKRR